MDGEPPQEEDFSQIPIIERSQHKNWKARLSAYNDVIAKSAKTASDTDPFFRPYVSDGALLRKWCLDANAVAQEKGIEAVLAIVQYSGESSAKTRPEVTPGLVEKALGAVRAGTKKKGTELCCMYVEVENSGEGVVTDVMAGLDAKQPKVVAGSIACLNEIIQSFGIGVIGNVKPLLKVMPKIFGHTDKNVRAEGSTLVATLYTYLGPALTPSLADLKPVQMTELQKTFDSMDGEGKGAGTGKPTRWTRKAQRERESAEAAGVDAGGEEEAAEEAAPIDPRSLLDPVNALAKFPDNLDEQLSSTKWKERLEVLEECNKIMAQPAHARISDSNIDAYGGLVATLGTKCKSDANINVVMEAAKVIEGLANGIGKPFGRFRGVVMPGMIERLKERKANVVEALGKALDAVFTTTTLSEIVEDVLTGCKSKNPQVREGSLKFLLRSLQTTTDAPGKDQVKPMAEALVALLGDSLEPVRTSAAECLGTMMKILGERTFNPYIENVPELQMAKVKDAFGRAEIKYRGGGAKSAPAASKPAAPAPVKKALAPKPNGANAPPARPAAPSSPPIKASGKFGGDSMLDEFAAPPVKAPPARFAKPAAKPASSEPPKVALPPPPTAKKPAAAVPSAKAGPSKALATSPSEPVKYRYSNDDALAQAADLIPANFQTSLADGAWKVRLEAAEEMIKWVEEEGASKVDSEIMMRFLAKTPGWGEKNFQVSAKIYQIIQVMADKSPTFGKPAAALCIGHLTDKLGDMKLKKPAGDALTIIAEKTSLAFVLAQGYEPMSKQKAPKAQADALTWIKQQANDFGIAGIPLRDLISFIKSALGSPNALVRASATQLLVTVKVFVGGDISGFLEDLNPQLLSTINSEFEKASSQTPPEPTRTQADLQEVAAGPGKQGKGGSDPLDDLVPRVDLDKIVNQTSILADSRSDAWKVRKEAFEALSALLEVKSNQRLKPTMGEIGTVLKKAMADTNLSVKMLALGIIAKIATGMGQPFDKYNKLLTPAVASVCADQKATTRSTALATLSTMAQASGGMDGMYSGLATSCETANPALRAAVLGWLAEKFTADPPASSSDLQPLARPVVHCLEDRNGDVRKAATAVLPFVVANAGADFVMEQTSGLKPASRSTIIPLIEKARPSAPTSAAPSAPPAAGPSKQSVAAKAATPAKARAPAAAPTRNSPAPSARPAAAPVRSLAMKALSTAPSSRQPVSAEDRGTGLPKPRAGLARPASSQSQSSAPSAQSSATKIPPFQSDAPEPRTMRLKKDSARWILETSPKADLTEYLAHQMEHHASPELFAQLFSKDHRAEEDFMAALSLLAEFYSPDSASQFGLREDEAQALQLANLDMALKYAALKLLVNNTQINKLCLEVITNVIDVVARCEERFPDAEAKLFVPALVYKLGDAKFVPKLTPIFDSLHRVMAASQVVQLLVQYGLEDKTAGKTCKTESLQLIEKAYRKRGSILRSKDDRGFYEVIARCISDSGTRNAALSVMALLQLQGGSKALEQVVEAMPQGSKDMLANRRATMAASKAAPAAKAEAAAANSPVRPRPATGIATPSARAAAGSPASMGAKVATPATRLPRPGGPASAVARPESASSGSAASTARGVASPSGSRPPSLPRPTGMAAPTSRLPKGSDPFAPAPRTSMMPLGRFSNNKPTNGHPFDPVTAVINDVAQGDVERSIIALKQIQAMLNDTPHFFEDSIQTLTDTLVDSLDRAFTPPEAIREQETFRLVKHLLQSFSAIAHNNALVQRLAFDDIYAQLASLSLHLVQADRLGGDAAQLAKYFNLVIIQSMSLPERLLVFRVMFGLLYDVTKDFAINKTDPEGELAAHADLILKCMWKRCKVLDEDFKTGKMEPGKVLRVLEEFLDKIGPKEWRRRAQEGVALGELPLRTVKTILQRMATYCATVEIDVYDILMAEFGDSAADTIVYTYLFRIAGTVESHKNKPGSPPTELDSPTRPGSVGSNDSPPAPARSEPAEPKTETEPERLVRGLTGGDQKEALDQLYSYIKANPDKEDEVWAAASSLSTAVKTYIRRMLENRKAAENPSPPRNAASPIRSPSASRPASLPVPVAPPPAKRGPRPSSLAVDKSAPVEDQFAALKNVFARVNLGSSQNGGEPLAEIDDQMR